MNIVRDVLARAGGRRSAIPSGQPAVLAVDIGTTRLKGVILDHDANVLVSSSIKHVDMPDLPGHHEHDAVDTWWGGYVRLVRSMLHTSGIPSKAIKCICITGLFPCFCPADEHGIPLHKALLYDDNQALDYVREVYQDVSSDIEGNELAGRIAWFRAEYPQHASKLRRVFSCHNYIVFRLTDRYCIDGHTALLFGSVFDPGRFSWNEPELARVGIDIAFLPDLLAPGELAGYVHEQAARETGLTIGTPVIAGTGDIFGSILGSGSSRRGEVFAHYGTTAAVIELTQSAEYIFTSRSYEAGDDGVIWRTALVRSGERFEGLLRTLQPSVAESQTRSAFSVLESEVDPAKANWNSAQYIPQMRALGGQSTVSLSRAGFLDIPLGMSTGDVYRTMAEGLGFMIRHNLKDSHLLDTSIHWYATGGGASSSLFCQLTSDALGHSQVVVRDTDAAIGSAIAAGCFAGFFKYDEVCGDLASAGRTFAPQDQLRDYYDWRFSEFERMYAALQSIE